MTVFAIINTSCTENDQSDQTSLTPVLNVVYIHKYLHFVSDLSISLDIIIMALDMLIAFKISYESIAPTRKIFQCNEPVAMHYIFLSISLDHRCPRHAERLHHGLWRYPGLSPHPPDSYMVPPKGTPPIPRFNPKRARHESRR